MPNMEKLNEIIKKLQKIMRIQDYDIELKSIDQYRMKHEGNDSDFSTVMLTETDVRKNNAIIFINKDHPVLEKEWYLCLVHELYHIVSARYRYISDRFANTDLTELLETEKENLVEHLAKIFISIYPESKIMED